MKLLLAATAAALAAGGSAAAGTVDACAARLGTYAEAAREAQDWNLTLAGPNGALSYFGAEHSRDPAHVQFEQIRAAYAAAAPTVVFFEGPDRGVGADAADTIKSRGESGYVRWLAAQSGAKVRSLEPSPPEQVAALLKRFPADQVYLFFTLREAARLRDREGLAGEALDAAVDKLLQRVSPMAAQAGVPAPPFADVAGLQQAYARYWQGDWREAKTAWFDPIANSADTGGVFTNDVNRADSEFRNLTMYRRLAEAALAGDRVFAVVGRNHVPLEAEALRCVLTP